jgi:hypothetical protein
MARTTAVARQEPPKIRAVQSATVPDRMANKPVGVLTWQQSSIRYNREFRDPMGKYYKGVGYLTGRRLSFNTNLPAFAVQVDDDSRQHTQTRKVSAA